METDSPQEAQRPAVAERLNVMLIREASEALSKLQDRTGLKKVDIVNRSISVYEFIDAELQAGNEIVVRGPDGRDQLVKFFF